MAESAGCRVVCQWQGSTTNRQPQNKNEREIKCQFFNFHFGTLSLGSLGGSAATVVLPLPNFGLYLTLFATLFFASVALFCCCCHQQAAVLANLWPSLVFALLNIY
jgi:hypothetical protein